MSGDDILNFLKTLGEGGASGLAIEVKGNTIEEALAHARSQFPADIPPEVASIIESTIRARLEREGGGSLLSASTRFADWPDEHQNLMLSTIVNLMTNLSLREPELRGDFMSKAIGHLLHCDQWKLDVLKPMVDWMLAHPGRLPAQVTTIQALFTDLCMGDPPTAREDFCSKRPQDTVDDFIPMMDACYPGMVHVAEVLYNHVDNLFEEGVYVEGFLSYAVPIVLLSTKQIDSLNESTTVVSADRIGEIVKQLREDKNLDTQYADFKLREMSTAFPATRYLEMRVSGEQKGAAHYAEKLHPLLVEVLDAAALLAFGSRSSDTVVH